jgi:hypothetical protein
VHLELVEDSLTDRITLLVEELRLAKNQHGIVVVRRVGKIGAAQQIE